MSRRTAESNKAIHAAWNKEQELVQEGKGTREWTAQQQKDILDKGKAYDENGVAFQGQHMKSVERYPEYQGDPGNIQFLTRAEHLEAHDGDWRNPTNWHFNPVTKEKTDFGDGKFIPCEIIQLADPVNKAQIKREIEKEVDQKSVSEGQKKAESNIKHGSPHKTVPPNKTEDIAKQGFVPKLKSGLKFIGKTIVEFPEKHPKAVKAIKGVGIVVATAAVAAVKESSREVHQIQNTDGQVIMTAMSMKLQTIIILMMSMKIHMMIILLIRTHQNPQSVLLRMNTQ